MKYISAYINHKDNFQRHNIPTRNNSAPMTCLLRKSGLLAFAIWAYCAAQAQAEDPGGVQGGRWDSDDGGVGDGDGNGAAD
jgi:hypothetical protein